MLLHIIDTSSSNIQHVKTVTINTVDAKGQYWYPVGVLFDDAQNTMHLVFSELHEELFSIKFPTAIDMNSNDATYSIKLSHSVAGSSDGILQVGTTATTINWSSFEFTVDVYGGKTMSVGSPPSGDKRNWPYILAIVPTSLAGSSSMIYVARTSYHFQL